MVGVRKTVIKNEWQLSGRIGYKNTRFYGGYTDEQAVIMRV